MENEILFTIVVKIVFGFMLGGAAVLIYNIVRKRRASQTESKEMAVFFSFFLYGVAVVETIVAFCILLIPFLIEISKHSFKDTLIKYILGVLPRTTIILIILIQLTPIVRH
ncbi:MAG: hypothetical protein ACTTIV_06525 [Campylobacter sp.]